MIWSSKYIEFWLYATIFTDGGPMGIGIRLAQNGIRPGADPALSLGADAGSFHLILAG